MCEKIAESFKGMIYNFNAVPLDEREKLKRELVNFHNQVHDPILAEYPTDNIANTPLGRYKKYFDTLYRMCIPITV